MVGYTLSRRKAHEPEDEAWLITFADMSVLLMSFFILMFALSSADFRQMSNISKSLRESGFYTDVEASNDSTEDFKKQLALAIGEKGYDAYIATSDSNHGTDVELASNAFFEPGSAKFSAKALPMLQLVAQKIVPLSNQDLTVVVEGHTDDTPISTEQFPSNWELSAARAANIVRYLIAQHFPANKLRAVGLGDTQPKAPNHDAAGNAIPANQNLNRRVVIKLLQGDDN